VYLQLHKPAVSLFEEQHWAMGNALCPDQCSMHCCYITAHLHEEQILIGVFATRKPAVSLFCRAEMGSEKCSLP